MWGHTRQCPRASSGRKYPSRSPDDCNRQVLILIKYNSIRNWNCNYWSHGLLGIIVGNSVIVIITNLEEIKVKSFRNPSFIMITINDNFRNWYRIEASFPIDRGSLGHVSGWTRVAIRRGNVLMVVGVDTGVSLHVCCVSQVRRDQQRCKVGSGLSNIFDDYLGLMVGCHQASGPEV